MNETKVLWALAIIKAFFYSFTQLAFSITVALNAVEWQNMSSQTKFTMCLGIFGSWGTTMMAFLTDAATKIKKGQIPTNGDTQFITKEETKA